MDKYTEIESGVDNAGTWVTKTNAAIKRVNSLDDGAFTIAMVGDLQYLTDHDNAELTAMFQWLVDNAEDEKIKAVFQLGDVTQDFTSDTTQFDRAVTAFAPLEATNLPFGLIPGNHDTTGAGTDFTVWNTYFPTTRYDSQDLNEVGFQTAANSQNYYVKFSVGTVEYLVLGMQWCPSATELAWAKGILDANQGCYAILTTHQYVGKNAEVISRYDGDPAYTLDYPQLAPTEMWESLKECPNLQQIWSGHMQARNITSSINDAGHVVNNFLNDYSLGTDAQRTRMVLLRINPAANTCRAEVVTGSTGVIAAEGPFPYTFPLSTFDNGSLGYAKGVDTTDLILETNNGATVCYGDATLSAVNGASVVVDSERGNVMKFVQATDSSYKVVEPALSLGTEVTFSWWAKDESEGHFFGFAQGATGDDDANGIGAQDYAPTRMSLFSIPDISWAKVQYQDDVITDTGEWNHYAITFERGGSGSAAQNVTKFFRNGELLNPELLGDGYRLNIEKGEDLEYRFLAHLGYGSVGGGAGRTSFDGYMDSVCVYVRALNDEEIKVLYNRQLLNMTSSPKVVA